MITSVIPKLPFIDKQATLACYTQQLGGQLRADYGDYFIIGLDAAELHFFSFPALLPEKSDFMIYLRIDKGIAQLYEKCSNATPPLKKVYELETKPWGQKEFAVIDPNGTLLTFGEATG